MAPLRRSPKRSTHRVDIHFAQPMTARTRHQHEDGLSEQLLPQLHATAVVVGGGVAFSEAGEPESADIAMDVTTDDIDLVAAELATVLEGNGAGRGSWVAVDGVRRPLGSADFVLLRTRVGEEPLDDFAGLTSALQGALGNGAIGWHDETFTGVDGPVYVFSGNRADHIVAALQAELPNHAQLSEATVVPVAAPSADG